MPQPPEDPGRQMAEALVASLEQLKQRLAGGAGADLTQAQRAGELAVEALKTLLPQVTDELSKRPPE